MVDLEEVRPGVALVTMQRAEKRNALSTQLKRDLIEAAKRAEGIREVRAVVLTGTGPVFCAGNDIAEKGAFGEGLSTEEAREALRLGNELTRSFAGMRPMTIAAVRGGAVGGGAALALACDFRIFAPNAWVHTPEVELGVPLGWETLPRLVSLVGAARAKRIAALCERVDADAALAWGLCDAVDADPVEAAISMGHGIARLPRVAQSMVK